MLSKTGWILSVVLILVLGLTLVGKLNSDRRRQAAEAEQQAALKAHKDAVDASNIAIAARQKAEQEKLQLDAALKQSDADLKTARAQILEIQDRIPRLERDAAGARKALADRQNATPPKTGGTPNERLAAQVPELQHAQKGWSVVELLPPDTLGVIAVRDVPTTIEKGRSTGLYRILSSPDFQRVFRLPLGRAQGVILMGEVMLGEKLKTLTDYLSQGEITLAVISMDHKLPDGQPLPDVLLSIQMLDQSKAFMEEFRKRLDQFKASLGGNMQIEETQLGTNQILRLHHPALPFEIDAAMCDETFLLSVGEGRIERLLTAREKRKALKTATGAQPAPIPGAAPEMLADVPSFKRALDRAGPNADVIAWANTAAIGKVSQVANRDMDPTQRHEWEVSGLSDVTAVSYSIGVKGDGLHEALFLDVPAGKRQGVLGLIDGESADLQSLYAAPRSSIAAAIFKVTPEKLLDRVVELAALDNPQARENLAAGVFFVADTLKLDVKRDILGSLTGQGMLTVGIPGKNSKLPLAFPQPLLSLQIKNMEGIKNLIRALATTAQEKLEFKEIPVEGVTITVAQERVPENPADPKQFCFAIEGNDLILSLYPLALRDEIHRRSNKGARLDDDPQFNSARSNLAGQPQAMLYVDEGALLTAAYDVLIPIAQIRNRDPQVDVNSLPTADLLDRNLGCALLDLNFSADGIYIEGQSSTGMVALLAPVALFAGRQQTIALNAAAMNTPAPVRGRARTGGKLDDRKKETLTKLQRDLQGYVAENGGTYPKTLDEMKPKYLQDLGKELENIIYRGKQAADNQVVAYTSEKLPGAIGVLLQNGSIESVLRPFLGQVLRDGVVAPNQAVKPPKPPDF